MVPRSRAPSSSLLPFTLQTRTNIRMITAALKASEIEKMGQTLHSTYVPTSHLLVRRITLQLRHPPLVLIVQLLGTPQSVQLTRLLHPRPDALIAMRSCLIIRVV